MDQLRINCQGKTEEEVHQEVKDWISDNLKLDNAVDGTRAEFVTVDLGYEDEETT